MINFANDLEFWMTNLPSELRTLPLIHLAIPGSHDSTTYAITKKSKISPDAKIVIQSLKILEPILGPFLAKWSKTQNLDISEQLRCGIRYFDLRIATSNDSSKFHFVHNLYAGCVDGVFEQIKRFLSDHPKEVVILDCQHFYNMNEKDHARFYGLLVSTFGPTLLPFEKSMTHITLDFMTRESHYQVLLIYRVTFEPPEKCMWPSEAYPTPWPNTVSTVTLIQFITQGLAKRDLSFGFVTQCVLTPTLWFAVKHLFSSLHDKCVLPLEAAKYDWLKKQSPGRGGINVVISDFIEFRDYQFPKEVINMNRKLLN